MAALGWISTGGGAAVLYGGGLATGIATGGSLVAVGVFALPLVALGGIVLAVKSASWSRADVKAKVVNEMYTAIRNGHQARITADLLKQFDAKKDYLKEKI